MDILRQYLSGQQSKHDPSESDTIEKLTNRVITSTLLEDRRDAVRALKSFSKKNPLDVGTKSISALINVLQNDRADFEIIGFTLETFCNIFNNDLYPLEDKDGNPLNKSENNLGIQLSEIFVQNSENLSLLLSYLSEYDFHVLWPAVRLITILLGNCSKEMQENILTNPKGISRLMDLLTDAREVIRNDDLLLLIQLTRGNTNIQKIVVFENAFEKLFDIISEEGNSDGGVIVEDCLKLLLNLLKNNTSNQTFLKEGNYIQRLPIYFDLSNLASDDWTIQRSTNVQLMLQMVRTMVSPNNPPQQTSSCQKLMNQCGLLEKLCSLLMKPGMPVDVLSEFINAVSELIRGNQSNQEYFASVMAPMTPPRPVVVVLLMSMVSDKQAFCLRCSILYCFQCFLYHNDLGQSQIIQTFLPSTTEVNHLSAGQLLCSGLFSMDPLSTWLSSVALLHSIVDNSAQKEQLLRVQLATNLGNPPVSFIQQCANILTQGAKLQTRFGILQLLCHWLHNCSFAVTHFLNNTTNVPYLVSQVTYEGGGDELEMVCQGMCAFLLGILILYNNNQINGYNRLDLQQVIDKRIGLDHFSDKLLQVSKHEAYSRASKQPQINVRHASDLIFDYEFTKLFKKMESEILRCVSSDNSIDQKSSDHDGILEHYKSIIREQDEQLTIMKTDLKHWKSSSDHFETEVRELQIQMEHLQDHIALLQLNKQPIHSNIEKYNGETVIESNTNKENAEISMMKELINQLQFELSKKEESIDNLTITLERNNNSHANEILDNDIHELQLQLQASQYELLDLRQKYEDSQLQIRKIQNDTSSEENLINSDLMAERGELTNKIKILEDELENMKLNLENQCHLGQQIMSDTSIHKRHLNNKISSHENLLTNKDTQCLTQEPELIHQITINQELNRLIDSKQNILDKNCSDAVFEINNLNKLVKELEFEKMRLESENKKCIMDYETVKTEHESLMLIINDQESKIEKYKTLLRNLGESIEDDEDDEIELDDNDIEDDCDINLDK